jgi:hypothetical protein
MPIRPELELLLACCSSSLDAGSTTGVRRLLEGKIDWNFLLRAAQWHGLTPLLHQNLYTHFADALPGDPAERLRLGFEGAARTNLALTAELLRILERFEAAGIVGIPLKGPALAAYLHGNVALRQSVDLDILVAPQDVPVARQLLLAEGYEMALRLNPAQESAHLQSDCNLAFVGRDGTYVVELHWQIAPRYFSVSLDTAAFWTRLGSVVLGQRSVPMLSPEDLLLVLCVHGAKHSWERLAWISDVAALIRRCPELDWELAARRAQDVAAARILRLGLFLAHHLLNAALPTTVMNAIAADTALDPLGREVVRSLANAGFTEPGIRERSWFFLRTRERWSDRLRYVLRFAWTPTPGDWSFVALPSGLTGLYPILRMVRLAGKYGLGIWQHSQQEPR